MRFAASLAGAVLALTFLAAALLFLCAGDWNVGRFWLFIVVLDMGLLTTQIWIAKRHPDLAAERLRIPTHDRDRFTRRLSGPLVVGLLALAGFDHRFRWSTIPIELTVVALAIMATGIGLIAWTQATNRFASTAVRIQTERGHQVVSHGPYSFVRHPMYLGTFLFLSSAGLALGSWPAACVPLPLFVAFVRRTEIEDRMLHDDLVGYSSYAREVRYKIVPFVY